VCVVYLSDGIDGSSAVDRELFVASVKQIHSECFTQTVLILTKNDNNNDDDDVMGKECGEDCQVIQSMLRMHVYCLWMR
jgi:ribosomal protein L36